MSDSTRPLALITGGTSGIGGAAAEALATTHDLALLYAANSTRAEKTVHTLLEKYPQLRVKAYAQRLTGLESEARDLAQNLEKDFSRSPQVLIHSAGRIEDALFMESDFSQQAALVQEHLLGGMALTRIFLKPMYCAKKGRILFLSSISAHYAKRGQSAYAAAKGGLESFARTLALEVAHRGITVNCIAPGLIETPMTQVLLENIESSASERSLKKRIPAGYAGSPQDVAQLIKFLCSDEARYMTGQTLTLDGGRSLGDPES